MPARERGLLFAENTNIKVGSIEITDDEMPVGKGRRCETGKRSTRRKMQETSA